MNTALFRNASAWIPLAMSAAALSIVLLSLVTMSHEHATDEETAAHLFQLLIAGQAPFAAFFALKWLPRSPGHALYVLATQAAAALLALAPVAIFDL
ncbi:MAG: hypothetical protein ABI769_00550 [Pseudomonadota bacterium]